MLDGCFVGNLVEQLMATFDNGRSETNDADIAIGVLAGRWAALASVRKQESKLPEMRDLLDACIKAGRSVEEPLGRLKLQKLAQDIGDAIYAMQDEYPNVHESP